MVRKKSQSVDWEHLIGGISGGTAPVEYAKNRNIFRQGDPADSLFYLRRGKVRLWGHLRTGQGGNRSRSERGRVLRRGMPRRRAAAHGDSYRNVCLHSDEN
jgi:hypothetical protein